MPKVRCDDCAAIAEITILSPGNDTGKIVHCPCCGGSSLEPMEEDNDDD